MSELDFEEEISIEEPSASLLKESDIDGEQNITMNNDKLSSAGEQNITMNNDKLSSAGEQQITIGNEKLSSIEESTEDKSNKDTNDINSKTVDDPGMSDGEIKSESDTGEVSDLEEGEINDPSPSTNNSNICHYFLRGTCNHGSYCRFIHSGASAYKMFGEMSVRPKHFVKRPKIFYYPSKPDFPVLNPTAHVDDNWDRALQEAKTMMLNARDKKETDVEFEEKKLYASSETGRTEKGAFYNSNGKAQFVENSNRCKQNFFNFKSSGHDFVEKENKLKKSEFNSKSNVRSQNWVDPWRRSRSRTQRSSSISSQSSGRHSSSHSSSSQRSSSVSPEKKSHRKKHKSKYNRRYSRTLSRSRSRIRSRSRSHAYSSRSRSCSRRRSSSFSSSRSRSRSSSASRFSRIYSKEYLPPKSELNSNVREKSPSHQSSKKRKLNSPLQEIKLKAPSTNLSYELEGSDMTVSCLSCTSLSCSDISSTSDNDSVKQNKRENIAPSAGHHDKKLLGKESRLKETQKDSRTNTSFKNDKNICVSKKNKSNEDYSSRFRNNPVDEKTYNQESDKNFSDNKHHKIYSDEKLCANKLTEELQKYQTSNTSMNQIDRVAYNESHFLSAKSSSKQDYFTKKLINLNLKPKSCVSDKSCSVSTVAPVKPKQPLSRREQLLQQLKAVELAIAKKKQL